MAVLCRRFPELRLPVATDVCYATRNRQQAVRVLAGCCARVLVLGSANSSNSQRLVETACAAGAEADLVSTMEQLDGLGLEGSCQVGLTAALTPEFVSMPLWARCASASVSCARRLAAVEEDCGLLESPSWMPDVDVCWA
jgi:4-hydroxy-3-methylbut-2-enyl diphosphate reductase